MAITIGLRVIVITSGVFHVRYIFLRLTVQERMTKNG